MGAGDYNTRFQWLKCVRTPDNVTGAKPKTFTDNGYLWGSVSWETAQLGNEFGAPRDQVTATIRVRNWPTVVASDRLVDTSTDDTYVLDGVRKGNNELIIDAHTLTVD